MHCWLLTFLFEIAAAMFTVACLAALAGSFFLLMVVLYDIKQVLDLRYIKQRWWSWHIPKWFSGDNLMVAFLIGVVGFAIISTTFSIHQKVCKDGFTGAWHYFIHGK